MSDPYKNLFDAIGRGIVEHVTGRDEPMTPTQPPAPTGASARQDELETLIRRAIDARMPHIAYKWHHVEEAAKNVLSALAEAGLVIVKRGDVSDALWAIGSRQTNDKDTIAAYDRLSDALAARQPEGVRE